MNIQWHMWGYLCGETSPDRQPARPPPLRLRPVAAKVMCTRNLATSFLPAPLMELMPPAPASPG